MKITIGNQKGGVGKTSIVANLGMALAKLGNKVLLVDTDPQFNLSFLFLGVDLIDYEDRNITELMLKKSPTKDDVESCIMNVNENLDILPSHLKLSILEKQLVNEYARELRLAKILNQVQDQYDFILIDTPPSLGIFMINSIVSSDHVIIPCEPSYFSIVGAQLIIDTVDEIKNLGLNKNVSIMGFIFNKYSKQTKVSEERIKQLKELYPDIPILGKISKSISIEKSESEGKTVFDYDEKISKQFINLAKRVMENV